MTDDIWYVCNYCHETFTLEESDRYYFDGEFHTICPTCGSKNIEEAAQCKVCRGIYRKDKMRPTGVCEGCFKDAVEAYQTTLGYLMPWQKILLEDEFGEIDITKRED